MKPSLITHPFHYQLIHNVFTDDELDSIWKEIGDLEKNNAFLPPEKTDSAKDPETNELLKRNVGVSLDYYYKDIEGDDVSPILSHSGKNLLNPLVINHPGSWFYKNVRFNAGSTLLSYYDHNDYYKVHNDISYLTICTWLYKEPKKFIGGTFRFPDYDIKIPCINNASVVFPSNINHSVSAVLLEAEDRNKGLGRYCITNFVSVNMGVD